MACFPCLLPSLTQHCFFTVQHLSSSHHYRFPQLVFDIQLSSWRNSMGCSSLTVSTTIKHAASKNALSKNSKFSQDFSRNHAHGIIN